MQTINISTSTIVRFVLILVAAWLLFALRDIIVLLFIVLILVAALSPTVERWSKYLTRTGAVIATFVLIFVAFTLIFSILIPPLVNQLREFSTNLPSIADNFSRANDTGFLQTLSNAIRDNINSISAQLSDVGGLVLSKTFGVISGIVAFITVLVLSFYLLLEEDGLKKVYKGVMPDDWYEALAEPTKKIAGKLGAWLRSQLLLMIIVGVFTGIGLVIIGVPYALTLAVWSGLTEGIPIIGPWLGAIAGVSVGLSQSPLTGFLALIVYLVVQQTESNLLVPKIMSRAVGVNPVVVILAVLIGGKLYGILGIMLGVPFAAVLSVVVEDWAIIRSAFAPAKHNS